MVARRAVTGVALVVLALVGWLLLAPQQVGGRLAVVSTYGDSMLPTYTASDLVVVARSTEYEVGDVVAYRSEELGAVVLHRIVDVEGDGYVTQGDNNDWLDPDRPTDEELMGTAQLRVPGAGRVLDVDPPIRAASVTALAGLTLFGGRKVARRQERRPRTDAPSVELLPAVRPRRAKRRRRSDDSADGGRRGATWIGWPLQTALLAAAVLVLALLLAVAAFTSPVTAPGEVPFTHRGTFTYAADAPRGAVYPDGQVSTGDPVFLRLVDRVDVAFDYGVQGPEAAVEPSGQLWVEVSDGSGWSTRVPLGEPQVGEAGTLHLAGTLDIPRLRRTLADVQEETGVGGGVGTLSVTAEIDVAGSVAGAAVSGHFAPELPLELGEHRLTTEPAATTGGGEPGAADGSRGGGAAAAHGGIVRTEPGTVTVPGAEPARLEFAGRGLDVAAARSVAVVAFGAALLAVVVAAVAAGRRGALDEASRIELRHGRRLVEVAAVEVPGGYAVVDVRDVSALFTLADRTDRPVLHHRTAACDTYLVEGDAAVYRYRSDVV